MTMSGVFARSLAFLSLPRRQRLRKLASSAIAKELQRCIDLVEESMALLIREGLGFGPDA